MGNVMLESERPRALLSVYDKTGIVEFATSLSQMGFELVSTGGTARVLSQAGLEVIGVKPFTRVLPDSSELPIPLISKIFDSKINDINIEQRGSNEIIVARTAEILNTLSKDANEVKEFTNKVNLEIQRQTMSGTRVHA